MNTSRQKLTVLIPTYNNEDIIEHALRSAVWADEILVVDSPSTDSTPDIARRYGARVIERKFTYHADQKNWAIPQAKYPWVLVLDSDEVITSELRDTIEKLLASKDIDSYDGYGIARQHYFLGNFLRWGGRYPLYNIRFFKRTCRYEDRNVHEHIILPKDTMKNIKGDMLHYSDRTLTEFFDKFNKYSTAQAQYLVKIRSKRLAKIEWKELFTNVLYTKALVKDIWFFIPLTSFARFVYMYIVRFGFLDGKHGFLIALLYSFQDYVSKTKYLELRDARPTVRLTLQKTVMQFLALTREARSEDQFSQSYCNNLSVITFKK